MGSLARTSAWHHAGVLPPRNAVAGLQIAVVHDPSAHRVRHYLNGSLINELPLDDATPLKLNQIVVGNWGFTSEPRNRRRPHE